VQRILRDKPSQLAIGLFVATLGPYVHLAFDEIRSAGAGSPQVTRRLNAALVDLKSLALQDRVAVIGRKSGSPACPPVSTWRPLNGVGFNAHETRSCGLQTGRPAGRPVSKAMG
jgi:hypothetical protein